MKTKFLLTALIFIITLSGFSNNLPARKSSNLVKNLSPITASNSGNTCISSTFNLFSTSAGSGYTYSWTGPNGFTSNQQNPVVTPPYVGSLMYTVTATNGITTETASTVIDILPENVPTFTPIAPICVGSVAPVLPTTSTNGITGTWNPSTVNTSFTALYFFTPNPGQCANPTTLVVTIYPLATPTFIPIASICQGSPAPILPTCSLEGFCGTWFPSTIDTNFPGTYLMTFTPDYEQCASTVVMVVEVLPNPVINPPPTLTNCGNNGYAVFDLSSQTPIITNDSNVSVTYHHTLTDAIIGFNQIPNPSSYFNSFQNIETIYFRASNNSTGCFSTGVFNLVVNDNPISIIATQDNVDNICVDFITNTVTTPLLLEVVNLTSGNYTYQWYANGVAVANATNPTYLIENVLSNPNTIFTVNLIDITSSCAAYSQEFTVYQHGPAIPIGIGYSIVNYLGSQILTVEVQDFGNYFYSLDGSAMQPNPVFVDVPVGIHTISVFDILGNCGTLVIQNIDVNLVPTPSPTGNQSQSFVQGATLADVVVNGQNIKWYDSQNPNARNTFLNNELSPNTILVNGTTYYASQKIGGYESVQRLPVTVQTTLKNNEFTTSNFTISPNPVETILTIKSKEIIKNIKIYNLLGQMILEKNNTNLNENIIDFSNLTSGYYILNAETQTEKTVIKVLKK